MADDAFLRALAALEEVIDENEKRATLIKKRMSRIRRARAQGLDTRTRSPMRTGR